MRIDALRATAFGLCLFLSAGVVVADDTKTAEKAKAKEKPEIAWAKTYSDALATAKKTNKLLMIDVYTDWCGWCKKLDTDTYSNEQVVKLSEKFVPVKINAEKKGEEMLVAQAYGVRGFPTILFLDPKEAAAPKPDDEEFEGKGGGLVGQIVGYMPPEPFSEKLESISASYTEFPKLLEAYKAHPEDAKTASRLIEVYQMRGQGEKARQVLEDLEGRGAKGDLASAYNAVGDTYQEKGQFDEAIALFRKALKSGQKPSDLAYAQSSIAVCYLQQGKLKEALPELEAVGKIHNVPEAEKQQAEQLLTLVKKAIAQQEEAEKKQEKNEDK